MSRTLRHHAFALAAFTSVVAVVAVVAACSSDDSATCDCADPSITIAVPADIAASVSPPQLSGSACTGVQVHCTNQTSGCSQYEFDANAVGTCNVVVVTNDTTFAASITIVASTGCCTGYFASPASAANILVPEPSDDGGPG